MQVFKDFFAAGWQNFVVSPAIAAVMFLILELAFGFSDYLARGNLEFLLGCAMMLAIYLVAGWLLQIAKQKLSEARKD